MTKVSCRDPIVDEVRTARESVFARFKDDLEKVAQYFSEREKSSGHPIFIPPGLAKSSPSTASITGSSVITQSTSPATK